MSQITSRVDMAHGARIDDHAAAHRHYAHLGPGTEAARQARVCRTHHSTVPTAR